MSHVKSFLSKAVIAAALCAPLVGCNDTTAHAPRVSLLLTDAPGDVQHAVVTISEIYLQGGSGERVVLMDTPVTTDLVTLANKTSELVKDMTVPAGTYSQLRFVVTGGYVEVDDGNGGSSIYASSPTYEGLPAGATVAGDLQMPSYAQSGIKVNLPGDSIAITSGHTLIVDFDVSRSFGHQAGNSGKWVMTPVLTATEFTESANITATVQTDSGVTLPDLNGHATTLADFNAVLTSSTGSQKTVAFTDNGGTFTAAFQYLAPGTYTLDIVPPTGLSATITPTPPATITLSPGQDTTTAFHITGAQLLP